MSLVQRTKFIVTEIREHVSHEVHTIEDFIMRHFGHTPVPDNVKIEVVETGHVENEQGNPNKPEEGPTNATPTEQPAQEATNGQASQPTA